MLTRSVSVIIPAFNEAKRLPPTLTAAHAWLQANASTFEIIVVDDGSTDGMPASVRALADKLPHVRVIANAANRGKGAVVRQGLAAGQYALRCYMDADGSTRTEELLGAEQTIDRGADIAVGSRYVRGSNVVQRQPLVRVVVSRLSNLAVRLLATPGIHDTQNGFKVLTAAAVREVLPYLSVNGWAFDVELLLVARRRGLVVREFPVTWYNDAASHLRTGKALATAGSELLGIVWRRMRGRYPSAHA